MGEPLGYLLTWTCYGTWVHGDLRGSVDDEHRTPGNPFAAPNQLRVSAVEASLHDQKVFLDGSARAIVRETIIAHCRHRSWELLAINVRSNHVHVALSYPGLPPETILNQFKGWSTRRLREARRFPQPARIWTYHGSTRYLWKPENIRDAVRYITEGQGPDLPG